MTRRREAEVYKETHESYTESIAAIMKASRALKMKAKEPKSLLSIDRKARGRGESEGNVRIHA